MALVQLLASRNPIRSVTIFKSSKAEVVRTFHIDLQEGQNKVEIQGLPSTIDTHSVRVSGFGDARLSDVVCTVEANKEASYATDSSSEVIRLLKVKKQNLESEKRVRDHEADLLVNYSKTLSGEHVPPSDMSTFLGTFVDQGRKNLLEIAEIDEKIVELSRQIEKEVTKSALKKGEAHGKVDVSLWAEDPISIELKLTYIVSNVSWSPTYELHATSENGKPSPSISFHYRARVKQSTGEDWTGTSLTLSTVSSDAFVKQIPVLKPLKLSGSNIRSQPPTYTGGLFNNPQRNQTNVNIFTSGSQGLFGNKAPAPASSVFGDANGFSNTTAFGNTANSFGQQPASNAFGSFGSANNTTQQQPSTGFGAFGSASNTSQQQPSTGFGAFGSNQSGFSFPSTGNPPPPNPLFGSSTNTTQPTQVTGGLFGSSTTTAQSPQGTGGFGSSSAFGQPTQGTSLFGSSTTTQGTGSLFGSSQPFAQPAQATTSLFGSSATTAQSTEGVDAPQTTVEEEYEEVVAPGGTDPATFVFETPVAISYSIHGKSTIPSDGIEHQVSVAVLPFEANISYVTIPRLDPRVYLQCAIKNTSDYRLLAGPCSVILDDSFVSKAHINDVNMGDNFECTLGDDPATKVTYSRTAKAVKDQVGAFVEAKKTVTHTTKITISNKHAFPISDLVIKDVIPTSDDKQAKVLLRLPEGLADAKDGETVIVNRDIGLKVGWEKLVDGKGGEKEGRYEWKGSVKAKDKLTLEAKWEVKGPADVYYSEVVSENPFSSK